MFGVAAMVPFAVKHSSPHQQCSSSRCSLRLAAFGRISRPTHRHRPLATAPNLSRRRALFTIAGFMVAVMVGRPPAATSTTGSVTNTPGDARSRLPDSGDRLAVVGGGDRIGRSRAGAAAQAVRTGPTPRQHEPEPRGSRALGYNDVFDRVSSSGSATSTPTPATTTASRSTGNSTRCGPCRSGHFRPCDSRVRIVFRFVCAGGIERPGVRRHPRTDPAIYVCLGDFHYGDNFVDDVNDYRQVFDVQLTQPAQAALYSRVPIAYVWDDHDYGPNDYTAASSAATLRCWPTASTSRTTRRPAGPTVCDLPGLQRRDRPRHPHRRTIST